MGRRRRDATPSDVSCNREGEGEGDEREGTHAGAREAGGAGEEELERRPRICGGGGAGHTASEGGVGWRRLRPRSSPVRNSGGG